MAVVIEVSDNGPYVIRGEDTKVFDADGTELAVGGPRHRAVPLRGFEQQAVLRRHARPDRLREHAAGIVVARR